jgi:hypothetical protein
MNIRRRSLGIYLSNILPSVYLYGHPYYRASYMFCFEIWSYSLRGYNLDKDQFLDIYVIKNAGNVLTYLAII